MRRVVSVWLPTWPADRWRRSNGSLPPDQPLVLSWHDGRRQVVAAADRAALALGLTAGMPLAHARALVPGLVVRDAEFAADARALARLAAWALRYTPMTSCDLSGPGSASGEGSPDGLWLDTTGADHLQGGEAALLTDLMERLEEGGIAARAAVADTPGAAHAVARFGGAATAIVPPGRAARAIAGLPVASLRLGSETVAGLNRLGFERVAELAAAPRAPLVRRFGPSLLRRLDQALGRVAEPISPVLPPELIACRLTFVEPILTAEAFSEVIARLVEQVAGELERRSEGARQLDLLFERVDGSCQAVRIGTARPSRDAAHLKRLLVERIETIDPGLGVEAMRLVAPLAEPLIPTQGRAAMGWAAPASIEAPDPADVADLVDVLENRLGVGRVYRAAPVESDLPERSTARVAPLAPPTGASWPASLPRPTRLFSPPQPVDAMALLPDQPPVAFTWRRIRHRVRRADGPERIFGEWWRSDAEIPAVRDYFRVEDEAGRRFWLFRQGDGSDPATGDLSWFLHGLFS